MPARVRKGTLVLLHVGFQQLGGSGVLASTLHQQSLSVPGQPLPEELWTTPAKPALELVPLFTGLGQKGAGHEPLEQELQVVQVRFPMVTHGSQRLVGC